MQLTSSLAALFGAALVLLAEVAQAAPVEDRVQGGSSGSSSSSSYGELLNRYFAEQSGPLELQQRQVAAEGDGSGLEQASSALSIYNGVGTTAFALPTAGACPVGYQSYTDVGGDLQCCAGSIVNARCFQDTGTLIYTLDPYSVIANGGATVAATPTTAAAAAAGDATSSSTSPNAITDENTSTITSYTPIATGGTRGGYSSTTNSRLPQTLSPTGGGKPTVISGNAAARNQPLAPICLAVGLVTVTVLSSAGSLMLA
ncbi:unnamed protein product [Jaminaea pallidilutea]